MTGAYFCRSGGTTARGAAGGGCCARTTPRSAVAAVSEAASPMPMTVFFIATSPGLKPRPIRLRCFAATARQAYRPQRDRRVQATFAPRASVPKGDPAYLPTCTGGLLAREVGGVVRAAGTFVCRHLRI